MGRISHIDSDEVQGLATALMSAITKTNMSVGNPIKEYDYPEDDEPDLDPYLGILPNRHISH